MDETFSLAQSVLYRFLRGGIAGAISTAASLTYVGGFTSWTDLRTAGACSPLS
jgi:hypothetical protein